MKLELPEIFASGVGYIAGQILLFVASLWVGTGLAAAAMLAGLMVERHHLYQEDFGWLAVGPALLLNFWILPNIAFLSLTCIRLFSDPDSVKLRTWMILIGVETLFAMPTVHGKFSGEPLALTVAWLSAIVMVVMFFQALFFIRAWRMNRWAAELLAVEVDNAALRNQLNEECGTEAGGGPPIV